MSVAIIAKKYKEDPNFYALLTFICAGFLLYFNTFTNHWTYDDYHVILSNPDVKSLKGFVNNSYPGRPLRELSAMLDYYLFGLSPVGWHIQSILWHSLNSWLVFILSFLLNGDRRIAWVASILFLVHPLHVEVVAQVSHRKDSLSLFFMLLTFICYLFYRKKGELKYLGASCCAFFLAVLSKQNALVLPLFLFVFEVVCTERLCGRKLLDKRILWLLLAIILFLAPAYVNIASFVSRAEMLLVSNNFFEGFSLAAYLMAIFHSWSFIFLKLVFPFDLAVNYVLEIPESVFSPSILSTVFLLAGYLYVTLVASRKNIYLFCSLLWLGLMYLPTANFIPLNHLAADRYMYAPSVGFFMGVACLLNTTVAKKTLRSLPFILMVIFFTSLTIEQNRVWATGLTLWKNSLVVNPNSARAISNSGRLLYESDDGRNLEMQLRAARVNPKDPFVQIEIGRILERRGDTVRALEYYKRANELARPYAQGMHKYIIQDLRQKLTEMTTSGA